MVRQQQASAATGSNQVLTEKRGCCLHAKGNMAICKQGNNARDLCWQALQSPQACNEVSQQNMCMPLNASGTGMTRQAVFPEQWPTAILTAVYTTIVLAGTWGVDGARGFCWYASWGRFLALVPLAWHSMDLKRLERGTLQ